MIFIFTFINIKYVIKYQLPKKINKYLSPDNSILYVLYYCMFIFKYSMAL